MTVININTSPILFEKKDGYAIITLNRPAQLNAFNSDMHHALKAALKESENDENIRSLIITGAGQGFCAGQDLQDINPNLGKFDLSIPLATFYNPLIKQLRALKKPKIVAVNGVVAGAGIGLVLACDIALCSSEAKFAMAFGKIGLVPDSGVTWFLVKLIGVTRAKALMLTNAVLTSSEAQEYGFVWRIYEPYKLLQHAEILARDIAHGSLIGTQLTIEALDYAETNTIYEQLDLEAKFQKKAGYSNDHKEGVSAFLEKRPPIFYKKLSNK